MQSVGKNMKKVERVITFKADEKLADDLQTALAGKCPLCSGTGVLTHNQRTHMQHFFTLHSLEKCRECNAVHFVCQTEACEDLH
jgi:DnaJ-class molecular chaperone